MKNNKGFTLVEVVVSFSLIMVVMVYLIKTVVVVSSEETDLVIAAHSHWYISTKIIEKAKYSLVKIDESSDITDENDYTDDFVSNIMNNNYLDIDENQIIRDVKFKTFGCGAAVATSSMATEMVKGKSIQEAMEVTNKAVMEALDGLPPVKVHCSLLAEEAIHAALWDYAEKHGIKIEGLQKPKSDIHEGEEAEEEEY